MTFNISIPPAIRGDQPTTVSLEKGEVLFLVGANGSGKSGLMYKLARDFPTARRLTAHRQSWMASATNSLTSNDRNTRGSSILSSDTMPQARYQESNAKSRIDVLIHDLIQAENVVARDMRSLARKDQLQAFTALRDLPTPLEAINDLLRKSGFSITLEVNKSDTIVATKITGSPYDAAQMSDGERNALLIAAATLTAPKDSILFIDEPERHFHRSISSRFITELVELRGDCAFVISTHELHLVAENPSAQVAIIQGCVFNGSQPPQAAGWDVRVLSQDERIDDNVKLAILGSKRKVLFVEGQDSSLDKPLYELLFPQATVISCSSCRDVKEATLGLKSANDIAWLNAYGLIDNDDRTPDDIRALQENNVFTLPYYSVESLYYHPDVLSVVAKQTSDLYGGESAHYLSAAVQSALNSIRAKREHLVERKAEKRAREEAFKNLPNRNSIRSAQPLKIVIDIPQLIEEETQKLDALISTEDLGKIVCSYPVRETGCLDGIAAALNHSKRRLYEQAALQILRKDEKLRKEILSLFGRLSEEIS